ncbi:DUF1254 domain-containing protein [Shimia abyssi]|uniref:Uncharacterized protein DUF1254 n=1 Tax=Shimia abyssi TaxID=1662395 RepID=A0A2P8FEC9_9RHOB|nr:DUF1254 domain-containing protein [Shimia abyssi]PSL20067.1 uncharacterized protein DUF1254 [Shimia abyssi]
MKNRLFATTFSTLILSAISATAGGLSTSLFNNPNGAQTSSDFASAPEQLDTRFGRLEFSGGGFPTPETTEKLYYEMDLQRATQAFMDFFPHLSLYTIVRSQARDLGFSSASDIGVTADFMNANQPYLTGNNSTIYAFASIDLKEDGPTVVDIPPGMYGTANDAAFRYLTDFGTTGPDKGEGGKFLFTPPGYEGEIPEGYYVQPSNGYWIWAMMRGFGEVGTVDQALDWFKERLKVYPLNNPDRIGKFVNASAMGMNPLPPEDASAFAMIDQIVQHEPASLFDAEQLGKLATLGIEKGKPFSPDAHAGRKSLKKRPRKALLCRELSYMPRARTISPIGATANGKRCSSATPNSSVTVGQMTSTHVHFGTIRPSWSHPNLSARRRV